MRPKTSRHEPQGFIHLPAKLSLRDANLCLSDSVNAPFDACALRRQHLLLMRLVVRGSNSTSTIGKQPIDHTGMHRRDSCSNSARGGFVRLAGQVLNVSCGCLDKPDLVWDGLRRGDTLLDGRFELRPKRAQLVDLELAPIMPPRCRLKSRAALRDRKVEHLARLIARQVRTDVCRNDIKLRLNAAVSIDSVFATLGLKLSQQRRCAFLPICDGLPRRGLVLPPLPIKRGSPDLRPSLLQLPPALLKRPRLPRPEGFGGHGDLLAHGCKRLDRNALPGDGYGNHQSSRLY
ncbi:MAG: hypothetical protein ACTS10_10965 [Kiloniellales bacterium]